MKTRSYYDYLALDKNVSTDDIARKYLELTKSESMPDVEKLTIATAYITLSDAEKRKKYDKKLVEQEFENKYKQAEAEFNTILNKLKKEIDTIKNMSVNDVDSKNLHNHFIESLDALYEEARDNLSYYIIKLKQKKSHILVWNKNPDSAAYQEKINSTRVKSITALINDQVIPSLKQLKFTPTSKNNDIQILESLLKHCETKCEEHPAIAQFFKAVAIMCLTGLGFIGGAIFGFVAGNLNIPVMGSLAAIPAAIVFACDAYENSLKSMKIPKINFGHSVLFKTPGYSSAKQMAQAGKEFINPQLDESSSDDDYNYSYNHSRFDEKTEFEYLNRQTFLGII